MKAVAVAAMMLLVAGAASAQTADSGQQEPQPPVFRSGASLVALNVTVQDGAKYITGLRPDDFAVYEDGVKQDLRFFESTAVPFDLLVLLDTSASMSDKIDVAHDAAVGFLRTLRSGDRGAVVAFSDTVSILQPLTDDRSQLEKAVMAARTHGATALYNAVYIALKQFGQGARQSDNVRRQAIVVLSDGEDTASLIAFDDVLSLARKMGVNIYTVLLQSRTAAMHAEQNGHHYFSESDYAMKTLARETGAQAFFPTASELKNVYASIATELASQYSIGYVPANGRNDGRFRRVIVQIVTHPNLRPRTRPGYTAEGGVVAARSSSYQQ